MQQTPHTRSSHFAVGRSVFLERSHIYIYCLRRTKQKHCVSPKRTSICVCVLVVFASFWRHQKTWLELRFVIWSSKMRFRNLHAPHHLPAGGPWDEDPRRGCNWSPGSFYCKHFAKFVHVWLIVPDGKEWFYVSNTNIQPSSTRANTSIQKKTVRFELSHPILTIYTSHMPRYPYIYIYINRPRKKGPHLYLHNGSQPQPSWFFRISFGCFLHIQHSKIQKKNSSSNFDLQITRTMSRFSFAGFSQSYSSHDFPGRYTGHTGGFRKRSGEGTF